MFEVLRVLGVVCKNAFFGVKSAVFTPKTRVFTTIWPVFSDFNAEKGKMWLEKKKGKKFTPIYSGRPKKREKS